MRTNRLTSRLYFVCLASSSLFLNGCFVDPRNHYVKTAEAEITSIPLAPPLTKAESKGTISLAVRGIYKSPTNMDFPIKAVMEAQPDPGGSFYRSRYKVSQERFGFGFDVQDNPHEIFDWFVTGGVNADATISGAAMVGGGLTLPFPLFNVRVAPAVGFHTYTNRTVDSTHVRRSSVFSGNYTDTTIYSQRNKTPRMGTLRALSVSLWPPPNPSRPWTPYIQYQIHWIGMSANDSNNSVPDKIIDLRGQTYLVGLDYAVGKIFTVSTRVARESLNNGFGSDAYYRIESGVEFRVPTAGR